MIQFWVMIFKMIDSTYGKNLDIETEESVCSDFFVSISSFFNISTLKHFKDCTARQCSPLRRKFMECYIIKPAQSLLMKHLVIGQR